MTDPRRERGGGTVKPSEGAEEQAADSRRSSKTEGTNRDFDESGEAANQKHGHPREERGEER
jgi:hypothetical protein